MVLKQIKTHNIQTHRDVTIDLPETGLVRFSGENSNGKSVIQKVINRLAKNDFTRPQSRNSVITFGAEFGELTLTRSDGVVLYARIHHEAAQTYVELRDGDNVIRRYLADKTIPELIQLFGIHYSSVADRSLNIMDSDEALLFYKTSYKTNGDLVQLATRDSKAERALEELERVTKETKKVQSELEKQIAIAEAAKASLTVYNIDEETETKRLCEKYAYILEHLEPMAPLAELLAKPRGVVDMPKLVLYKLAKPTYQDFSISLDDSEMIRLGEELAELKQGRCPVCKRRFFS